MDKTANKAIAIVVVDLELAVVQQDDSDRMIV